MRGGSSRIAEREPTAVGAHTVVGMILQMQGRVPEAQKKYERVIEINPNAAVAANNLAWPAPSRTSTSTRPCSWRRRRRAGCPRAPRRRTRCGWVYHKKGLATLAIASFERCVAKEPANRTYLYHQGLAQLKNGDTAKARESLQKALAGKADFPEAADARKALAGLGRRQLRPAPRDHRLQGLEEDVEVQRQRAVLDVRSYRSFSMASSTDAP